MSGWPRMQGSYEGPAATGAIRPAGPDGEADGARPSRTTAPSLLRSVETRGRGVLTQLRIPCTGKWAGARPQGTHVRRASLRHSRTAPPEECRGTRAGVVMPRLADPHVRRLGKRASGCTARTSAPSRPRLSPSTPCPADLTSQLQQHRHDATVDEIELDRSGRLAPDRSHR